MKKVLQEKLEAIQKVQDLEVRYFKVLGSQYVSALTTGILYILIFSQNSLSNTENECSHLLDVNQKKEQEIQLLLEKATENEKEIANLTNKLQVNLFAFNIVTCINTVSYNSLKMLKMYYYS